MEERLRDSERVLAKFQFLGETVKKVTQSIEHFRDRANEDFSIQEKMELDAHLPEVNDRLTFLVEETKKLQDEAKLCKLQSMERNTDALRKKLNGCKKSTQLAG